MASLHASLILVALSASACAGQSPAVKVATTGRACEPRIHYGLVEGSELLGVPLQCPVRNGDQFAIVHDFEGAPFVRPLTGETQVIKVSCNSDGCTAWVKLPSSGELPVALIGPFRTGKPLRTTARWGFRPADPPIGVPIPSNWFEVNDDAFMLVYTRGGDNTERAELWHRAGASGDWVVQTRGASKPRGVVPRAEVPEPSVEWR